MENEIQSYFDRICFSLDLLKVVDALKSASKQKDLTLDILDVKFEDYMQIQNLLIDSKIAV